MSWRLESRSSRCHWSATSAKRTRAELGAHPGALTDQLADCRERLVDAAEAALVDRLAAGTPASCPPRSGGGGAAVGAAHDRGYPPPGANNTVLSAAIRRRPATPSAGPPAPP